jgi:hypothetical protein
VRVNNHQIEVISTHRKIGHSPSISMARGLPARMPRRRSERRPLRHQ